MKVYVGQRRHDARDWAWNHQARHPAASCDPAHRYRLAGRRELYDWFARLYEKGAAKWRLRVLGDRDVWLPIPTSVDQCRGSRVGVGGGRRAWSGSSMRHGRDRGTQQSRSESAGHGPAVLGRCSGLGAFVCLLYQMVCAMIKHRVPQINNLTLGSRL